MQGFVGIKNIYKNVKKYLSRHQDVLLYAFNATGKTRLTYFFPLEKSSGEKLEVQTLCYNAIMEDLFSWDNENKIFNFDTNNIFWLTIKEEGLDGELISNFTSLIDFKLEPIINTQSGEINFCITTGDDNSTENVKISKGEETLFKWSVFYTVVNHAIHLLMEKVDARSIDFFNKLQYCIIDDPVSSIDDYRVYTVAVQIINLLKFTHENKMPVAFLIETHHALFYNLIRNYFKNRKRDRKGFCFIMNKLNGKEVLRELNADFPIAYHLVELKKIDDALNSGNLQKIHYNAFRSILEKFAIFLGYKSWNVLFDGFEKSIELYQILNMISHGKYVELESDRLTAEQEQIFLAGFNFFKQKYYIQI